VAREAIYIAFKRQLVTAGHGAACMHAMHGLFVSALTSERPTASMQARTHMGSAACPQHQHCRRPSRTGRYWWLGVCLSARRIAMYMYMYVRTCSMCGHACIWGFASTTTTTFPSLLETPAAPPARQGPAPCMHVHLSFKYQLLLVLLVLHY
jgi:hypothetical protein